MIFFAAIVLPTAAYAVTLYLIWTRGFARGAVLPEVIGRREATRDQARLDLHRMADALRRSDNPDAAELVERCALALAEHGDLAGALDFWREAEEGGRVLAREQAVPGSAAPWDRAVEAPVYRSGELVGYLAKAAHEPEARSLAIAEDGERKTMVLLRQRAAWVTDATADRLAARLPPGMFRAAVLLLVLLLPAVAQAARTYHPEALAWVAAQPPGSPGVPTHLRVEGEIAYVHYPEGDGDTHLRLCHNRRCMVAECVPGGAVSPETCARFRVGQRLAVFGISRYDGAPGHGELAEEGERGGGHWEIHPVEGFEVIP